MDKQIVLGDNEIKKKKIQISLPQKCNFDNEKYLKIKEKS